MRGADDQHAETDGDQHRGVGDHLPCDRPRQRRRPDDGERSDRPTGNAERNAGREPEQDEADDRQPVPQRAVVDVTTGAILDGTGRLIVPRDVVAGHRLHLVRGDAGEISPIGEPPDHARKNGRQEQVTNEVADTEIELFGDDEVRQIRHRQRVRCQAGHQCRLKRQHLRRVPLTLSDADVQRLNSTTAASRLKTIVTPAANTQSQSSRWWPPLTFVASDARHRSDRAARRAVRRTAGTAADCEAPEAPRS